MSEDWIDALTPRGAALIEPGRRFAGNGPPAGPEGAKALLRAISAFRDREDVSPVEEDAFIENAGAFLGLLLLHEYADAQHVARGAVHRVRLSADGFFDPFGVVDACLETDDPRAVLMRALHEAEQEAQGRGPLSRVVAALRSALDRARPDLVIETQFDRTLWLSGGMELDLSRVVSATRGESAEAVASAVEKLVAMLAGAGSGMPWSEARAHLVPRTIGAGFDLPGTVVRVRAFHEIDVTLQIAEKGRARYIRHAELAAWDIPFERALDVAISNLAQRSERVRLSRADGPGGPILSVRTGDGFDAARLLLPRLREVLISDLGDPCWIGTSHRDALIACARGPLSLVEAVAAQARETCRRAPHPISETLLSSDALGEWLTSIGVI